MPLRVERIFTLFDTIIELENIRELDLVFLRPTRLNIWSASSNQTSGIGLSHLESQSCLYHLTISLSVLTGYWITRMGYLSPIEYDRFAFN